MHRRLQITLTKGGSAETIYSPQLQQYSTVMMKITQGRNILRSGSRAATATATRTAMLASRTTAITSSRLASTSRSFATSTTTLQNNFKYDAPWFHYSEHSKEPHVMNFINGSFEEVTVSNDDVVSSSSSSSNPTTTPLFDPSSNKVLSYVPESHHPSQQMDSHDNESSTALNRAVAAAKQAYPAWSNTPVQSRQRLMLDYAHFLHRKEVREEIAYWITLENGKTMADAMGDVWRGLEVVEAATRVGNDMLVRFIHVLHFECYALSLCCTHCFFSFCIPLYPTRPHGYNKYV